MNADRLDVKREIKFRLKKSNRLLTVTDSTPVDQDERKNNVQHADRPQLIARMPCKDRAGAASASLVVVLDLVIASNEFLGLLDF